MRIRATAVIASLLVATPIIAQQAMPEPGAKEISRVTGGAYSVDPNHTLVSWEVDHLGFTPYFRPVRRQHRHAGARSQELQRRQVDITIPVSKVATANAALTGHLLRAPKEAGGKPDFFGPAPADAHFVSTSVVANGSKAKVAGDSRSTASNARDPRCRILRRRQDARADGRQGGPGLHRHHGDQAQRLRYRHRHPDGLGRSDARSPSVSSRTDR